MKNSEIFKRYLLSILFISIIFIIIFILVNVFEYNIYKLNFNYKINGIIELVLDKYDNVEPDEIIEILNSSNNKDNILSEYGYNIDKDSYIYELNIINRLFIIVKVILLIILFLIIIYIFIRYNYIFDIEINKIIKCIENINHKNYELGIEELSEDKLSILKQEIYKTTIMLKENAENSLKDKINIKNLMQDISHQLKTPLTSINILLDNIIDNPDIDNTTKDKFIMQIKRECINISFLVQSILKLSKFETNTIKFNKEEVSINKIINESIKNVSNLSDLLDININVNNYCKKKIKCDYRWQIEAITNILKNALEYSYNKEEILVSCNEYNLYTEICIKDNGIGMDYEDVRNIFKRFYKGKDAKSDSIGIGLALAKEIIEKDNGIVVVDSEKGVGTTFKIRYYYE